MVNHVLRAARPRLTTPLFAYYTRQLRLSRIAWQSWLILLLGAAHQLRVRRGQLDELRLSDVEEHGIVAATFAAWQLRVWRFVVLECALRVARVAFNFTLSVSPENRMFPYSGIQLAFNITGAVVITITYAFEPLWRMHALGSTALLWGVRLNNPVLAGVHFWLTQLSLQALVRFLKRVRR